MLPGSSGLRELTKELMVLLNRVTTTGDPVSEATSISGKSL